MYVLCGGNVGDTAAEIKKGINNKPEQPLPSESFYVEPGDTADNTDDDTHVSPLEAPLSGDDETVSEESI